MDLIIVHYHLRPGGVRRIIEQATPQLVAAAPEKITRVVLATGEAADPDWHAAFARSLQPVPVEVRVEDAFNYLSEQKRGVSVVRQRIRAALERLLGPGALVWAHNLGVGRNLILARELTRGSRSRQARLVMHHHDWWFDNRWLRWPELRRWGFRTLPAAARAVLPSSSHITHLAINREDAEQLRKHFDTRAGWLPNLTVRAGAPDPKRVKAAKQWLGGKLGDDAPVWLLPCRLLRRKNVAEACLLTRWLRPEAWLVTTGGVSSADEQAYATRLEEAARAGGWRLRLSMLAGAEGAKPSVPELLVASEAVVLTSVQEGFGLPFLEAAAAGRPLVARAIPNIAPDLARFGFRFPQCYAELLVDPRLFDWAAERHRQRELFQNWRSQLPKKCQELSGKPAVLAALRPRAVSFSRLTLSAQLEVLAHPPEMSWKLCALLNPFLGQWRKRAAKGRLEANPWPREADGWLGGPAYGKRFHELVRLREGASLAAGAGVRAQEEFIRARLEKDHLFPLLWSQRS